MALTLQLISVLIPLSYTRPNELWSSLFSYHLLSLISYHPLSRFIGWVWPRPITAKNDQDSGTWERFVAVSYLDLPFLNRLFLNRVDGSIAVSFRRRIDIICALLWTDFPNFADFGCLVCVTNNWSSVFSAVSLGDCQFVVCTLLSRHRLDVRS